jgi:hypothetical protein
MKKSNPTSAFRIQPLAFPFRGHWHVISPSGIPIFDNAPYGQDKPVIFHDEDKARDCAERLNKSEPSTINPQPFQPHTVLSTKTHETKALARAGRPALRGD